MEQDMFRWIEWIVVKSLPLRIVDDPLSTCDGVRYKPFTLKLLHKYILAATSTAMTALVAEKLPNDLAIVFDGWTVGYYIDISACTLLLNC